MTKQELIEAIKAELAGSVQTKYIHEKGVIGHVIDALGIVIACELFRSHEIPLPGLGKLMVVPKAARKGRNPRTGQPLDIPAGHRVAFKPGKDLKEALSGK